LGWHHIRELINLPDPAHLPGCRLIIVVWEQHLTSLRAYKCRHGDCNVPRRWAEDPPLGRWVGNQRKFKRALDRGDPRLEITVARSAKLEALGFAWETSAAAIS
jgi:hypothetical protein